MQCNKTSAFWEQRAKCYVTFKDIFEGHDLFEYASFILKFPDLTLIAEDYTEKGIAIFDFLLYRSIDSTDIMTLNAFLPLKRKSGKDEAFFNYLFIQNMCRILDLLC